MKSKPHSCAVLINHVDDVRSIFKATLDLIHAKHTTDSDQYSFATLFGIQEYVRKTFQPGDPFKGRTKKEFDYPTIKAEQRTQYQMGVDYEAVIFQTMAFFRHCLTWMTFDMEDPKEDKWGFQKSQQHIVTND